MKQGKRDRTTIRLLFERLQQTGERAVRDELIEEHMGLCSHLARRFTHRGEAYEDLSQVAALGLVKAVDGFDPGRGVDFLAYATKTIVGELKRHFRDKAWAVRAPRRIQELYLNLGRAEGELSQVLQRHPTLPELMDATDASERDVLEALNAGQGYRSASLDAATPEDDGVSRALGEEDGAFGHAELRMLLSTGLDELDDRDREILRLRFAEGLTQLEIAAKVGLSQMHVSRLLAKSLVLLRQGCADALEEAMAG